MQRAYFSSSYNGYCSRLAYTLFTYTFWTMYALDVLPRNWSVISYISSRKPREDNGFMLETVPCLYITNSIKIRQSPVRVQLSLFHIFFSSLLQRTQISSWILCPECGTSNIVCMIWKHCSNQIATWNEKQQPQRRRKEKRAVNSHKMRKHLVI